jgi:CRISPR/Cas system-associated exonuclease Cas4 (RecB family)
MPVKEKLGFKEGEEFELERAIDFHLNNKQSVSKERDYFYASELGSTKKELYEKIKNNKQFVSDAKTKRIFGNGDAVHERYFRYFYEMGIMIACELEVNTELIHGRLDCIITDGDKNYVVDIKSSSQWTFQKLKEPPKNYILQLQYYMYQTNIEDGMILFECKDNQSIKIFKLKLDKKLVENYLNELSKLKQMIVEGIEPVDEPLSVSNLEYN